MGIKRLAPMALMLCVMLSACGSDTDSSPMEAPTEPEVTETEPTQTEEVVFEEAVEAQPGQAYLAIVDGQWWVQYWGTTEEGKSMLSYDAGVCDIDGDGSYTVSLNADTVGFRYDTTKDPYGEYTPSGLNFAAVIIKDGGTLCPNAIITIDSIVIDGKEIQMTAKNYTSTEDGHIRSNIYNGYIDSPSGDARCPDGFLFNDGDPDSPALDNAADFSPIIVDKNDFASWTKIEVNFTITTLPERTAETDASGESSAETEDKTADEESVSQSETDASEETETETDISE